MDHAQRDDRRAEDPLRPFPARQLQRAPPVQRPQREDRSARTARRRARSGPTGLLPDEDEPDAARLEDAQRDQPERVIEQMRDDVEEEDVARPEAEPSGHGVYFSSGSTASGGRPIAACVPATTIGRCSRTGWAAIALTISALARSAFFLLERLELGLAVADQLARIAADQIDQLLDLGLARRLLEILADRGLDALASAAARASRATCCSADCARS